MVSKLSNLVLDILFPTHCIGCTKKKTYLCTICLEKIPISSEILYGTSSIPKLAIPILATTNYKKAPLLREALHFFKYKRVKDLGVPLASLMRKRIEPFLKNNPRDWVVVPLPLHRRKQFERGFNQNDELVETCFKNFPTTLLTREANPLTRTRFTKSQTKLTGQERIKNIQKSFALANTKSIHGKSIIIVDDVLTTGATLEEAATTLLFAGAKEVWGFVLARD